MKRDLRGLAAALNDLRAGALDAYREGREDHRAQFYAARKEQDLDDTDAPRWQFTTGTNPSFYRTRELLNQADPINQKVRSELGMDLRGSRAHKIGQVLGTLGADITQDTSRGLWWLLNAPQATADVVLEQVLARSQPDLYRTVNTHVPDDERHYRQAVAKGLVDYESGRLQKGVTRKKGRYHRRAYHPGTVAALGIPAGVAVNAGMGLFQNVPVMDQLSAMEGYEAAVPDANDRSETANVLAEVGAKYLLGRTGNLLGYDDGFALQRPDVSRGEYGAYKAFKYDKAIDLNPFDDGEITLPAGVAKATADGIHGPEVQFLGRSLPLTTAGVPFLGAVAGTALGARFGRSATRAGFVGGSAGLAAGLAAGHGIEGERRRRNFEANNPGIDYESYRDQSAKVWRRQKELLQQYPQQKGESRTGSNSRNQISALRDNALELQARADLLISAEDKERQRRGREASALLSQSNSLLGNAQDLENQMG